MGVNQVLVGDEVKLDLTADTVSEDNLLVGVTAHNAAGEPIVGAVVTVPVDSELSETSINAIQNMAVAKAVKGGEELSGSTGYIATDSVEYPLVGLKVFGKSTQGGTPTPENPVEIVSVVEPTVTVCGKNLFTKDTSTLGYYNADLVFIESSAWYLQTLNVRNINKLTMSGFPVGNQVSIVGIKNDEIFKICSIGNQTIDVGDYEYIKYSIYKDHLGIAQIELGLTATDYEPYTSHTLSLPGTLNAIPVSSGGNVTIDGQEYIADYKDFGEGKCHRLVDPDKLDPTVSIIDNLDLLLETEEITDIPEAEMQAYRQLQTYNGITNISNDKGAGLSVKYCTNKALSACVAPITTGLQKQIDELKSAVLSLGGNV